jgi:voltage-gated potassium channel
MKFTSKIWELLILVLSIYTLVELSVEVIVPFHEAVERTLEDIDFIICMVFLADFFFFWYRSDDKLGYLKRNWLDLLSSIPYSTVLRAFRCVRIFRIVKTLKLLQLLKGLRGILPIVHYLQKNKIRSILITYFVMMSLIILYCSLAFYMFEKGVNPNVHEFFDCIWWAFVTVTSVGYGDVAPVTKPGKIVAVVLTLAGMGFFSLVTAGLSAKFIDYLREERR